ncbi:MAG: hypothetical protein OD816_000026 [Thermodesulfobacterium sp.]|uniref:DUF5320 domain-containing protein n=1 Tax=Candidatus Thermodesulfobacterium syntrophicum TaxID=3060442 RepID=A0AAE3TDV2_9BACT|nr:hypothetical protein [Candidatus Thermodesulfobacterium syntrophicum]
MPWGDRTGPLGLGPRTGRGLGFCSGFYSPGFTKGPGFSWGWRWWGFGTGFGRGRRRRGFGRGMAWRRGWGWL